jgi:hypothetical protein
VLSFYLLPAFAAVLKIRAKKLAQIDVNAKTSDVVTTTSGNLLFFDSVSSQLSGIFFYRNSLTNDINSAYSHLLFKKEAFYQFNYSLLNQFKVVTFFL